MASLDVMHTLSSKTISILAKLIQSRDGNAPLFLYPFESSVLVDALLPKEPIFGTCKRGLSLDNNSTPRAGEIDVTWTSNPLTNVNTGYNTHTLKLPLATSSSSDPHQLIPPGSTEWEYQRAPHTPTTSASLYGNSSQNQPNFHVLQADVPTSLQNTSGSHIEGSSTIALPLLSSFIPPMGGGSQYPSLSSSTLDSALCPIPTTPIPLITTPCVEAALPSASQPRKGKARMVDGEPPAYGITFPGHPENITPRASNGTNPAPSRRSHSYRSRNSDNSPHNNRKTTARQKPYPSTKPRDEPVDELTPTPSEQVAEKPIEFIITDEKTAKEKWERQELNKMLRGIRAAMQK